MCPNLEVRELRDDCLLVAHFATEGLGMKDGIDVLGRSLGLNKIPFLA